MFPGFVTLYKDKDNFINLYFYPGISDTNEFIYKPLELVNYNFEYQKILNDDYSIIYKFANKNIKSITCKLVSEIDTNNIKLNI